MVYVDFAFLEKPLEKSKFMKLMDQLPLTMHKKIISYRRWEDACNSLVGKILLNKLAERYFNVNGILEQLTVNAYQRPEVKGSLSFSISHSGNLVACAMSHTTLVGIDVEQITPIEFTDYENYMTGYEWQVIQLSKDPVAEFFRYWTQKEAAIKADGRGLAIDLSKIEAKEGVVKIDNNFWFIQELWLRPDYKTHLATSFKLENEQVHCFDQSQSFFH